MDQQSMLETIEKVRAMKPLVHNITNVVVTNFTANGLLALGASPVMTVARDEAADMARIAGALVLNIGTLDEDIVSSSLLAGRSANAHGVPVVFDPVGAGATAYRTDTSHRILKELRVTIVRGNAAEIANLLGLAGTIKGVDAAGAAEDTEALAVQAAQAFDCVVVITGKDDYVSDGRVTYKVIGGTPLLTYVTGTGCLLTSIIGAFAAAVNDPVAAAVSALSFYGAAAVLAERNSGPEQPGSFQTELINQLYRLDGQAWRELIQIERIVKKQ
ncbi:hydroxyethylthiazole kinase [Paenibacillus sp. GD4]|uniref:hydroxyethylthiazole kinase n=1 Tax=Paenibacillus sp. GD4 TaxID=3068890 RepID=UPI00279643C3|nr:hydroxyethylthiazole kinase [Paenibacillus sp. GD4]MDQ1912578.1 hydroxyethylthiazole kinase [Paenibacillus sp. GD4]